MHLNTPSFHLFHLLHQRTQPDAGMDKLAIERTLLARKHAVCRRHHGCRTRLGTRGQVGLAGTLKSKVQHGLALVTQRIGLFNHIFSCDMRRQAIGHARVLAILVGIHADHDIDAPIGNVLLPVGKLRILSGEVQLIGLVHVHP